MWQALALLVTAGAIAPFAEPMVDARLKDLGVEMVIDTPGRTGACDVLRFTPDGKHLVAAGDDKVVRVWKCDANGLVPATVPVLRWSIYREQRGGIYALDLVGDPERAEDFRVAIAGVGIRTAAVVVLDNRGKVLYGLPRFEGEKQEQAARTLSAVWSVSFSPAADRVAFGGSNGTVWLWDLERKALRLIGSHPEQDAARRGKPDEVRLVAFIGQDRLISVAADGYVLEWDLRRESPVPRTLFRFEMAKNLACVAIDSSKNWLAAGGQTFAEGEHSSAVELRSLDGTQQKALELPSRNFPKRLGFDPASQRLAVATYMTAPPPGFYLILGGGTYLFDLREQQPEATAGPKTSWYVDALAFHPDGHRFVVGGGDDQDVTLWDLRRPAAPISRIAGPGKGLWGVGLSKDLRYLGYRDQRNPKPGHPVQLGQGEWRVFDLRNRRFASADESKAFEPVAPLKEADGWSVKPDSLDPTLWYVVKGGVEQKVPLSRLDKLPRCYTFLKSDADHPTRLVVGHVWGMSVFALGDDPPRLLRKFAGHQGEVMAVAPSEDGKFLVSASRDQTVAFWSLQPQANQDESGARFEPSGDTLIVKDVAAGSPAWEAHLKPGDSIRRFFYEAREVKDGPAGWQRVLKRPAPGSACEFVFERGGTIFQTMTTNRQRPLARFFPMDNREWILWRYYDFYYDCSTNGDRYVAWQLSGDVDVTPRIDPFEHYRKRFFKPEKVAALLSDLNENPERVSLLDIEAPTVAFAASPEKVTGGIVRLSISARPAGDLPEQRVKQVNLWVNGAIVQEWIVADADDRDFRTFYDLPATLLRHGRNLLTVQAYNRAEIRRDAVARVDYDKPQATNNLYALVVGIGDYESSGSGLPHLSASKDADAVQRLLAGQKKLFARTNVVTLRDREARRERILDEITQVAKLVQPDDTFVLFMGGHGASGQVINDGIGTNRSVKPEKKLPPHLFVFCTHDFAIEKPLVTGLPSEDLYREIRRLNCRTFVLLDACHSGTIVEDPVRQLAPEGVGPVILSACEARESAVENEFLGDQYTGGLADGLFTIGLILALDREFARADTNHDRLISAVELSEYLRHRVPGLLKSRTGTDLVQHPTGSLPELEKNLPIAAR